MSEEQIQKQTQTIEAVEQTKEAIEQMSSTLLKSLNILTQNVETAEEREERLRIEKAAGGKTDDKKSFKEKGKDVSNLFSKLFDPATYIAALSGFGLSILGGITTAFATLGTSLATTIGPTFLKLFPPVAIITGLGLAIKDGLIGWTQSNDWGVSSISGFLGGFFGGAADGGIKNAFANAGKFAILGAGIGSVVPVVGTIAGGLIGAAIGGIFGFIGGRKLAEGFDGIGAFFKKQFDTLILAPIKAVWDVIAPDWVKSIDFMWSDLFPPALTKLFGGEYFTVDFPEFSWVDLFPKFLVDLFNNVAVAGKDVTFEWKDLLPEFFIKFFKGEYSTEGSFSWRDLVPGFILKVIDVAKTAWADTEFSFKSLLPNFIVKLIEGTEVKPTGTFSWRDLVPEFIWKLTDGAVAAASTKEGFMWSNLLPDWMKGAYDSTVGLAKQSYFSFKNLLPEWMQPYITTAEGEVAGVLATVGSWNWKSLLPKFILDFIDDPTQLAKEDYKFSWKSLLPEFIVNLIEGKPVFGGSAEGGSDALATGVDLSKINLIDTILRSVLELVPETFLGVAIRERVAKSFGITADKDTYKGGIVATKPTWLPGTGTVVGEHSTWQGKGAYSGGIPMDGGAEAVIPLDSERAGVFIDPMARSIAGQVMNQMAMERVAMQTAGMGASSAPIVTDNSTQIVNNNTTTTITNPIGQMLPGESDDFVRKVA